MRPLQMVGGLPNGVRASLTESWGSLGFILTNPNPEARLARLLAYFPEEPDRQYGRDVWLPGNASLTSWLLIGPAAPQKSKSAREVQFLFYDRTDGQDRLLLSPSGGRFRSQRVGYSSREPVTTLLMDPGDGESKPEDPLGDHPEPLRVTEAFRECCGLSAIVSQIGENRLPPIPEAFEGIDHFVLASDRLAGDTAGMLALRHWVLRGGKLWIQLDRVSPETVALLLGGNPNMEIVDRTSLTSFAIRTALVTPDRIEDEKQELEQPVEFVRVAISSDERILHTVNGWPASFMRPMGRGRVLFTTLGARAWYRFPTAMELERQGSRFHVGVQVPLGALQVLAGELQPPPAAAGFMPDAFAPVVSNAIGYSIPSQTTAAALFAGFLLTLLLLGVGLRYTRRPELVGWVGSAVAVLAASTFVWLGSASRHAVAPTVAVGQVVEVTPSGAEAEMSGLLAVYRPESGPVKIGMSQGGLVDLDQVGLEGQTRRFIMTDAQAWHWENLALTAGVRTGRFRAATRFAEPLTARAHFGPSGLVGQVRGPAAREFSDVLLQTPTKQPLAVHLQSDGSFQSGSADQLLPGQFLSGSVLTDQQQQHQDLYRQFLVEPGVKALEGRTMLLAWAAPQDLHFTAGSESRTVGQAMFVLPLEFEASPPGTPVTVPAPLVAYRRLLNGASVEPTLESKFAVDMQLRFQIPKVLLPLQVERARLHARVMAPARPLTLLGQGKGGPVTLHEVEGLRGELDVAITDAQVLHLDPDGGLVLTLRIGDVPEAQRRGQGGEEKWSIEGLGLEIGGQTALAP